jgi:hypothetical protein
MIFTDNYCSTGMLMIPSGSGCEVFAGYCEVMNTGIPQKGGE